MRLAGLFLSVCALITTTVVAQTGDQMLDGIGETGMIARYTFKTDANDWSRNNLHARIDGRGFSFVKDSVFGNVLALKGDAKTYMTIPGEAVFGEESLSISGWLFMKASTPGQVLLDYGKNANAHVFVLPMGTSEKAGFQVQVQAGTKQYVVPAQGFLPNAWNHVAFVIDVPSKTLSAYLNGKLAGEVTSASLELTDLFDMVNGKSNQLYVEIGRASCRERV